MLVSPATDLALSTAPEQNESIAEQTPSGAKTAVKIAPGNQAEPFVVFKLLNWSLYDLPMPKGADRCTPPTRGLSCPT